MKGMGVGPMHLERLRTWSLRVAIAFVVCCLIGWIFQPAQFYRSYLFAWLFWLGISLGAMGVVMLHHLTGGEWGQMVRRLAEHAAGVMPLLFLLFIPIAIGVRSLYPWARPEAVAADPLLQHKQPYLNVSFFLFRALVYGVLWSWTAWYLRRGSLRYDRTGDPGLARRLHNVSAAGMLLWFVSMSFAAIDWIMSRDPHWYSTVFGFIVVTGQALSGVCVVILLFSLLVEMPPFRDMARPEHFNDLGNLLLTCVITWTYMAFVQFLVMWMGNEQEEIPWYVRRLSHGWQWIGLMLVCLHFFVPLIVLLMRDLKRKVAVMFGLCAGLLILRACDVFWMVAPPADDPRPTLGHVLSWMDFIFPIGMGSLWILAFLWLAAGHPLIPEGDTVPRARAAARGAQ